jgi:hypothetical protein
LESLNYAAADPDLAGVSLRELSRLDVWFRAYALPMVLRAAQPGGDPRLRRAAWEHLEQLTGAVPDDLAEKVMALREASRASEFIAAAEECVHLLARLPDRSTSAVPYLDLKDFLPETLILTLIAAWLEADPSHAPALREAMTRVEAQLPTLLARAEQHASGRQAFRLALKIAAGVASRDEEQLSRLIWTRREYRTELELDVLQSWAEVLYDTARDGTEPQHTIIDEYLGLFHLRGRLAERQAVDGEPPANPVLPAMTRVLQETLGIIFWQAVLLESAVRGPSPEVVAPLLRLWQIPGSLASDAVRVAGPVRSSASSAWRAYLNRQLNLRWAPRKLQLQVEESRDWQLDDNAWLLFSPWVMLSRHPQLFRGDSPTEDRYPEAGNPVNLVRLFAAALSGIHLLRDARNEESHRSVCVALLLHAADVLEMLGFRGGQPPSRLEPEWAALFLFVQHYLQHAGTGQIPEIAPDLFCRLLGQQGEEVVGGVASRDRAIFLSSVVPGVVVDWISAAFPVAAGENLASRWLCRVPEVSGMLRRHYFGRRVKAAALARFLAPETDIPDLAEFDWRESRREWRVDPRQLLLFPGLSAVEWDHGEWSEDLGNDADLALQRRLTRALERLASLLEPAELDPELRERWRADWAEALMSIHGPNLLDPFARLRLLELFDHPLLQDAPDDRELIALALLEHGDLYDLEHVLERIYPTDTRCWSEVPTLGVQQVRLGVLPAILDEAERIAASRTSRLNAQHPMKTLREYERERLLRDVLLRIAFFCRPDADEAHRQETGRALQLAYVRRWKAVSQALRRVEIDTSGSPTGAADERTAGVVPPEWKIRSVAFDPNRSRLNVEVEDLDMERLVNLFEQSPPDVRRLAAELTPEGVEVLAIVADAEKVRGAPDQWKCVLNCGLDGFLTCTVSNSVRRGELIAIRITWVRTEPNENGRWGVAYPVRTRRLNRSLLPGSIHRVAAGGRPGELELKIDKRRVSDLDVWIPDLSWHFRGNGTGDSARRQHPVLGLPAESDCYAERGARDSWEPVGRDLVQLLLEARLPEEGITILSYAGLAKDDAWRFVLRPGFEYRLRRTDFVPEASERLVRVLAERHSLGMLVTVEPVLERGTVRLRLSESLPEDVDVLRAYPDMQVPLDPRNVAWRKLLVPSDILEAQLDGSTWQVPVDPPQPGFPQVLKVRWNRPPPRNVNEAEASVSRWDPWTATVSLDPVRFTSLQAGSSDDERLSFVTEWLALKKGDVLRLSALAGDIDENGSVPCLTRQLVRVLVEVETLSMRGYAKEELSECVSGREALVTRAEWRPVREAPRIDESEVPASLQHLNRIAGVVTALPAPSRSGPTVTAFDILWRGEESSIRSTVHFLNRTNLGQIYLGARLTGWRDGEQWRFTLENPRVFTRALWRPETAPSGGREIAYLGTVFHDREKRGAAETGPGRFIFLPGHAAGRRHLAEGDGERFRGGFDQDSVTEIRPRMQLPGTPYVRVAVGWNGSQLFGTCLAQASTSGWTVAQVRMDLSPAGDDAFLLRRTFVLAELQQRVAPSPEPPDEQKWEDALRAYLQEPQPLRAHLPREPDRFRLSTELRVRNAQGQWVAEVPLAPDEGRYVVTGRYDPTQCQVWLFERPDGMVVASLRRVPPFSARGFQQWLSAPYDTPQTLDAELYYVGPEVDPDGAPMHRFEWGYGFTLLVLEAHLRFKGEEFANAKQVLFHGDALTGLTFKRPEDEDSARKPAPDDEEAFDDPCLLSFDSFQIQYSEAHSLFTQRRQHKVVHALTLKPVENDAEFLTIQSIMGWADSSTEAAQSFSVPYAVLDEPRPARSLAPAGDQGEEPRPAEVILARLDTDAFASSLGKIVLFRKVRLTMIESEKDDHLIPGEVVLFRAGAIKAAHNDTRLDLHPLPGISPEDIGKDCTQLTLTRRRFSVREHLLRSLEEMQGKDAIRNSLLMVRLSLERGRTTAEVRTLPPRKPGVLRGLIPQGEDLATVARCSNASITLELRPGVLVRLAEGEHTSTEPLARGAVVRVGVAPDMRFSLTRAAFDESRYIPETLRPAVALPFNPLLNKDGPTWSEVIKPAFWARGLFSIGSLPNLVVTPGDYDPRTGTWQAPKPDDFVGLMKAPHPKLVLLGVDQNGDTRIQPDFGRSAVGGISVTRPGWHPRFIPLERPGNLWSERTLRWEKLSFADEGSQELARRVASHAWTYHDTDSGHWLDGGRLKPVLLGRHTGSDGPLFFEEGTDGLRLRYTHDALRRHGLSSSELAQHLSCSSGGEGAYVVAGTSDKRGLWIELAPGRVVELPASLLAIRMNAREVRAVEGLWWDAFAPGDRVWLSLATRDPLRVDRFVLEKWEPGPRGAFSSRDCYLPVLDYDAATGAVRVGAGQYALTLPCGFDGSPPEVIALSPDNDVRPLPAGFLPRTDDVVLLALDQAGTPVICGFPDLVPVPQREHPERWGDDPLLPGFLAIPGAHHLAAKSLGRIIAAAGGTLPVTVDWILNRHVVFFTRRAQVAGSRVPAGSITQGQVVGLLPDGRTALVRSGGGLLPWPLDGLVSGLPAGLAPLAADVLAKEQIVVWIRVDADGQGRARLEDEVTRDIRVTRGIPLAGGRRGESGWLCRSVRTKQIYWLPEQEIGWTDLSPADLPSAVPMLPFEVRLLGPEGGPFWASMLATSSARLEAAELTIGKELGVDVVASRETAGAAPRYLVRSTSTGIVLECRVEDDRELSVGEGLVAEVVWRNGSKPEIGVVPAGSRRYQLDLPRWMLDSNFQVAGVRPGFTDFLERAAHRPAFYSPPTDFRAVLDKTLREMLSDAWFWRGDGPWDDRDLLHLQTGAASEWVRRHADSDEMDLHYALVSVLLLQWNVLGGAGRLRELQPRLAAATAYEMVQGWSNKASSLAQNMGRRARRSLHVEAILRNLGSDGRTPVVSRFSERLALMRRVLQEKLGPADVEAVHRFWRAVHLHQEKAGIADAVIVADALRRAFGELDTTGALRGAEGITQSLAELYRTIPQARSGFPLPLQDFHAREIETLLKRITSQRLDIVLLRPLPALSQ